jgi:hypothetical protein
MRDPPVLNAILTNTGVKIIFGGLDPDDADLIARLMFTGHLNIDEWKEGGGSARPVTVGHDLKIVRSSSRAENESEHDSAAETVSRTRGRARSTIAGTATAKTTGTSVGSMSGTASGTTEAQGFASGTSTGEAETTSLSMTPDFGLIPPTILGQGWAQSTSAARTDLISSSRAASHMSSHATSRAESEAHSHITSEAIAETDSDATGVARARPRHESRPFHHRRHKQGLHHGLRMAAERALHARGTAPPSDCRAHEPAAARVLRQNRRQSPVQDTHGRSLPGVPFIPIQIGHAARFLASFRRS